MRVAARLGMSIQEAKRKHTSTELGLWLAFFEWEVNAFHREDYFFARMCKYLEMAIVKDPSKVKEEQHHLKFKREEVKPANAGNDFDKRLEMSKNSWSAFFSVTDAVVGE